MADTAVARSLNSYLTSSRPGLRAQGQYLQTGQAPHGYTTLPNGVVHANDDMKTFMDKYGWALMLALPTAGYAVGSAIPTAAAAGGSSAASSGLLPSTSYAGSVTAPTATAGNLAGGSAAAAGAAKGAGMFGLKDLLQIAPTVASLFHGKPQEPPQNDAMNELIQLQTSRLKQSDPLYQAILQMAMRLAPRSARPMAPPSPSAPAVPRRPY